MFIEYGIWDNYLAYVIPTLLVHQFWKLRKLLFVSSWISSNNNRKTNFQFVQVANSRLKLYFPFPNTHKNCGPLVSFHAVKALANIWNCCFYSNVVSKEVNFVERFNIVLPVCLQLTSNICGAAKPLVIISGAQQTYALSARFTKLNETVFYVLILKSISVCGKVLSGFCKRFVCQDNHNMENCINTKQ